MSDGPRSHRIPLNGGAIKVITLQTIKKGHESPGQLRLLPRFQSWAVFSLPPLCPGRSIWLGTRFRSCRRRSSRGRGCHQTWFARRRRLATTSHNGTRHRLLGRKEGGRSDSFSDVKQSYCRCMRPRSGTHWCQSDTSALHLWCTDHPLSDATRFRSWAWALYACCYFNILCSPGFSCACKAASRENLNSLLQPLFASAPQMASKLECTQIYYIPLFVPDSIKVSCKEIIPLLQEIVALLLSVFF